MLLEEKLIQFSNPPSQTETDKIMATRDKIVKELKEQFNVEEIKAKYGLTIFNELDIYLQGSYRNSTNIRFDSDVDIIAQCSDPFFSDKSQLSDLEKQIYNSKYSSCSYSFDNLKNDIFHALKNTSFSNFVEWSDKCIKIKANGTMVNADVVPCFQHRFYKSIISHDNENYVEGIQFINTKDNNQIINYPKKHIENCSNKNTSTNKNFKSLVRIFKNIRNILIEKQLMSDKVAPSYFIENLLYNCTDHCFSGSFQDQMTNVLQFLWDAIEPGRISGFICANEQNSLISEKTWNIPDIDTFIRLVINYFFEEIK